MKVRIVYCSITNHPFTPPGRIVSVRVESDSERVLLQGCGIEGVAVYNSTAGGFNPACCKMTKPIEIEAKHPKIPLVAYLEAGSLNGKQMNVKMIDTKPTGNRIRNLLEDLGLPFRKNREPNLTGA